LVDAAEALLKLLAIAAGLLCLVLSLLVVPIALLVATPFVLLWPPPRDNKGWGKLVRARYWRVARFTWLGASLLPLALMDADVDLDNK
jgi:hypothetical protein